MTKELLILLVDDHASVRAGIKSALNSIGHQQVIEAASYSQAQGQIATLKPTAIVVDIHLGDGDGLSLVSWVRSISKSTAIIVLSLADSDDYILAAMESGASAFISKAAPLNDFLAAFDHALKSPESFSSRLLPSALMRAKQLSLLTARELSIVVQLNSGLSNRELAQSLFISEATLKSHLSSIFRKLQVKNRIQAISAAKKAGLLQEDH
jgi:DNA-binding NarL/FixJ family response regulator